MSSNDDLHLRTCSTAKLERRAPPSGKVATKSGPGSPKTGQAGGAPCRARVSWLPGPGWLARRLSQAPSPARKRGDGTAHGRRERDRQTAAATSRCAGPPRVSGGAVDSIRRQYDLAPRPPLEGRGLEAATSLPLESGLRLWDQTRGPFPACWSGAGRPVGIAAVRCTTAYKKNRKGRSSPRSCRCQKKHFTSTTLVSSASQCACALLLTATAAPSNRSMVHGWWLNF